MMTLQRNPLCPEGRKKKAMDPGSDSPPDEMIFAS